MIKDILVVIKFIVLIGINEEIEDYINRNLKNDVKVEFVFNLEFLL